MNILLRKPEGCNPALELVLQMLKALASIFTSLLPLKRNLMCPPPNTLVLSLTCSVILSKLLFKWLVYQMAILEVPFSWLGLVVKARSSSRHLLPAICEAEAAWMPAGTPMANKKKGGGSGWGYAWVVARVLISAERQSLGSVLTPTRKSPLI